MEKKFNIRVYGLLINSRDEILVSDEFRLGVFMTKFPGGGLKFGEGTIDCLKREFLEETGMNIEVSSHFYTTDFFQPTFYLDEVQQIISIYYFVKTENPESFSGISEKPFDFDIVKDGAQKFRWLKLSVMSEKIFTLPIDKKVAEMIRNSTEFRKFYNF